MAVSLSATAATYNITPKAPKITPSLKPIIVNIDDKASVKLLTPSAIIVILPDIIPAIILKIQMKKFVIIPKNPATTPYFPLTTAFSVFL